MAQQYKKLSDALWQIYNRPDVPQPWQLRAGNLPWDDPDFSERMLLEHLDESHGAASRQESERLIQINWLWRRLGLEEGQSLLDVTCGPGLYAVEFAKRGVDVTAVDFSPAAINYAQDLAQKEKVVIDLHQQDIREMDFEQKFDAAILLYGQLAVFSTKDAQAILKRVAQHLKPGGKLCVELLNPDHADKKESNWWFTDETGLWGNTPFLHFGERIWLELQQTSIERYHIINLETGEMNHIELCDRVYKTGEMAGMMQAAGLTAVDIYPEWDMQPLYDAQEWIVYIGSLGES